MAKNNFMSAMMKTELPKSMYSQDEKIKKNIIVLEVLKKFIPPLSQEEKSQLEQNIVQFGCKDPLIIWETASTIIQSHTNETTISDPCYVLLDGHNRFEICQKYDLDFKISVVEIDSFEKAQDFMIDHQLGRRNLSIEQMAYLRGMKYLALKQEREINEIDRDKKGKFVSTTLPSGQFDHHGEMTTEIPVQNRSGQNDHHGKKEKLSEQLAKEFNVGEKTIRRDADFAKGIERLPQTIKNQVLQGKSPLSKTDIIEIGKIKDEEVVTNRIEELLTIRNNPTEVSEIEKKEIEKKKIVTIIKNSVQTIEECDELIKEIKKLKKEISTQTNL